MKRESLALALPLVGAVVCFGALLFGGWPRETMPAEPVENDGTGTLSVRITFEGAAPANRQWDSVPTPQCPEERREERRLAIGTTGGVQDVLVRVLGLPAENEVPAEPVVIEHRGCQPTPRVVGLVRGQSLLVRNADHQLHNAHATSHGDSYFNRAVMKGTDMTEPFRMPVGTIVRVGCDLHLWEAAHVAVMGNRHFGVTDAEGSVVLQGLPEGTHELEVWHPEITMTSTRARAHAGKTSEIHLALEPRDLRHDGPAMGHRPIP